MTNAGVWHAAFFHGRNGVASDSETTFKKGVRGRPASGSIFLIPYRAGQTALQVRRALPLQNAGSVRPRLLWFPILVAQFFVVPVRAWLRRASLPLVCCRWNSGRRLVRLRHVQSQQ